MNDEYIMIANGIWINPLGTEEIVQPLPWAHKEQPFYSAIIRLQSGISDHAAIAATIDKTPSV